MMETTYAAWTWSLFSDSMQFWDFILLIISIFVLTASVLSILFILWWGLLLILSWGKDDKIKPAINTIRYAVFWIIITVAIIFLFPILGNLLGLDVEQYAEPNKIFEKIEDIWNTIFGNSSNNINWSNIDSINELPSDFSDL